MTRDTHDLTETFWAHEDLAPDAAEVLERAHGIARSYHRRRWVVRATGGAVLTAAVVAGSIGIAGEVGNSNSSPKGSTTGATFLSSGDSSPTPAPTYTDDQEMTAFFDAGYAYEDAVQLAKLWNTTDVISVKATAGKKLLEGETLPVDPSGTPATATAKAQEAFFNAGYDYYDAEDLATIWHETDLTQVKTEAGQKLEAGDPLPIKPGAGDAVETPVGESSAQLKDDVARTAFFSAGYSYEDAVTLAGLWHESDTFQVKADAGKKLEAGDPLPIPPSGPAEAIHPSVVVRSSAAARKAALHAARKAGLTHKVVVISGRPSH